MKCKYHQSGKMEDLNICTCNGVIPSPWRDVREELPEPSVAVLCLTHYGMMDVCCYNFVNKTWVNSMRTKNQNGGITHWMPLPAPPAGKGEA